MGVWDHVTDIDYLGRMVGHPNRPQVEDVLTEFIIKVRAVNAPGDTYDIQRELLSYLISAERRYNAAERARRARHSALDWDVEFWRRTTKQMRSVGDAIAWKFLGYRRMVILLLGRNQSPGHMAIKAGSQAEVTEFDLDWQSGNPALLTGLTNCITIGDVLRFRPDERAMEIVEVKTSGRKPKRAQMAAINRVLRQINDDQRVESGDHPTYFVESPIRQRSHWSTAQSDIDRANRQGLACWSPAPGVAVQFVSVAGSLGRTRPALEARQSAEQASMAVAMEGVTYKTRIELAAVPYRSARTIPFPLVPIKSRDAASLMTGSLLATVELSVDAMAEALRARGIEAAVALPEGDGSLTALQPVLRWRQGRDRGTVHANALEQLAIELQPFDLMADVLASRTRPGSESKFGVFVCLADEGDVWA